MWYVSRVAFLWGVQGLLREGVRDWGGMEGGGPRLDCSCGSVEICLVNWCRRRRRNGQQKRPLTCFAGAACGSPSPSARQKEEGRQGRHRRRRSRIAVGADAPVSYFHICLRVSFPPEVIPHRQSRFSAGIRRMHCTGPQFNSKKSVPEFVPVFMPEILF